jgi:hypothetical protein
VLREALTERGAAALAKDWIDSPQLGKFRMDRERLLALIRGRAAMGIVLSQNVDDLSLVEKAYQIEDAHCRMNKVVTKWYSELVSALAVRDTIAALGREGYLKLQGTGQDHKTVEPYIRKYAWHLEKVK